MRNILPISAACALALVLMFPMFAHAQEVEVVSDLPPELAVLDAPDPKKDMALGGGKVGESFFNIAAHHRLTDLDARGHGTGEV